MDEAFLIELMFSIISTGHPDQRCTHQPEKPVVGLVHSGTLATDTTQYSPVFLTMSGGRPNANRSLPMYAQDEARLAPTRRGL